jgi:hypothetical protein
LHLAACCPTDTAKAFETSVWLSQAYLPFHLGLRALSTSHMNVSEEISPSVYYTISEGT